MQLPVFLLVKGHYKYGFISSVNECVGIAEYAAPFEISGVHEPRLCLLYSHLQVRYVKSKPFSYYDLKSCTLF